MHQSTSDLRMALAKILAMIEDAKTDPRTRSTLHHIATEIEEHIRDRERPPLLSYPQRLRELGVQV